MKLKWQNKKTVSEHETDDSVNPIFFGGGGNSIEKKNRISSSLTISADQLVKQNI